MLELAARTAHEPVDLGTEEPSCTRDEGDESLGTVPSEWVSTCIEGIPNLDSDG